MLSTKHHTRMNDFHILAHGEEFDVDAFLATTKLRPDLVWRRGDQKSACFESKYETSGLQLSLGDGLAISLWDQEKIALVYLREQREELRALGEFPGNRVFLLSLNYFFKLDPSTVGFWVDPCRPLMRHCLDIGIHLTYHVRLDRRAEWGIEEVDPDGAADGPS